LTDLLIIRSYSRRKALGFHAVPKSSNNRLHRTNPRFPRRISNSRRYGYDCIKIYDDWSKEGYEALVAAAQANKIAAVGHLPRNLPINSGQSHLASVQIW